MRFIYALGLLAFVQTARGVVALPNYHAEVNFSASSANASQDSSVAATVGSESTRIFPSFGADSGAAFASASRNSLKGYSNVSGSANGFSSSTISRYTINDLIFTGGTGGMVNTDINLEMTGVLSATISSGFQGGASVGLSYQISDATTTYISESGTLSIVGNGSGFDTPSGGGIIGNDLATIGGNTSPSVDAKVAGSEFSAPTGVPLSLTLEMDTGANFHLASMGMGMPQNLQATSDFADTLQFTPGVPVFDNPDGVAGFSANSAEAGVVNDEVVTPEPAVMALIFLAWPLVSHRIRSEKKNEKYL